MSALAADLGPVCHPAQRHDQHRPPAVRRQPPDPGRERLLDPPSGGRGWQCQRRHRPGPLGCGQPAGQLDQRQRVPAGLRDQLIADRQADQEPVRSRLRKAAVSWRPAIPRGGLSAG